VKLPSGRRENGPNSAYVPFWLMWSCRRPLVSKSRRIVRDRVGRRQGGSGVVISLSAGVNFQISFRNSATVAGREAWPPNRINFGVIGHETLPQRDPGGTANMTLFGSERNGRRVCGAAVVTGRVKQQESNRYRQSQQIVRRRGDQADSSLLKSRPEAPKKPFLPKLSVQVASVSVPPGNSAFEAARGET